MNKWTRTDKCQTEIDKALREAGALVFPTGNVGKGFPDRVVAFRGQTYLMEMKNADRLKTRGPAERANLTRTPMQIKFHLEWNGGPLVVVFTPEDALRAIGAIPARKGR